MKFFSFIFIFYLLLLSWLPCQDLMVKDTSRSSAKDSQSVVSSETPTDDIDDCSPFCVCSCCASTATAHVGFSIRKRYFVSTQDTAAILYRDDYSQQHLNSIWQPPKFDFAA